MADTPAQGNSMDLYAGDEMTTTLSFKDIPLLRCNSSLSVHITLPGKLG